MVCASSWLGQARIINYIFPPSFICCGCCHDLFVIVRIFLPRLCRQPYHSKFWQRRPWISTYICKWTYRESGTSRDQSYKGYAEDSILYHSNEDLFFLLHSFHAHTTHNASLSLINCHGGIKGRSPSNYGKSASWDSNETINEAEISGHPQYFSSEVSKPARKSRDTIIHLIVRYDFAGVSK